MDLSVPAHRSKTSKQAICAAVAELGDVSGAPATSVLSFVGSRIIPGDFYVHSSVMSVHSGSVIAFFVARLTLSSSFLSPL